MGIFNLNPEKIYDGRRSRSGDTRNVLSRYRFNIKNPVGKINKLSDTLFAENIKESCFKLADLIEAASETPEVQDEKSSPVDLYDQIANNK